MFDDMTGIKDLLTIPVALPIGALVKYVVDVIKQLLNLSGVGVLVLVAGLSLSLSIMATIALPDVAPDTFTKLSTCTTIIKGVFTGVGAFIVALKVNKLTNGKPTEESTTTETGE